jgi:hypothetical protein
MQWYAGSPQNFKIEVMLQRALIFQKIGKHISEVLNKLKKYINVINDVYYKHAKSQCEILCILGYRKYKKNIISTKDNDKIFSLLSMPICPSYDCNPLTVSYSLEPPLIGWALARKPQVVAIKTKTWATYVIA